MSSSSDIPAGYVPGMPRPAPYAVVFGPKANCTLELCPLELSVYGYRPNLAANISFIALYAFASAIHIYLGIRWRSWWFMGCMMLGAVNAVIGYVGRVLLYYNPFSFPAFMLQIICVTTGPVYYCAAIYITLSMAINCLSPQLSRFQPKLFYWIFIPCDFISLILQAGGGALSTASAGSSQTGVNLALVGLSFQVATVFTFCAFFADYLIRYFRSDISAASRAEKAGHRLYLFFGFTATAIVLILVRSAYRLAELHAGYRGDMIRDEPLFIALEGVIVLAAVFCLMVGHPGFVFKLQPRVVDAEEYRLQRVDKPVSFA